MNTCHGEMPEVIRFWLWPLP